jgi:hypothetical protein
VTDYQPFFSAFWLTVMEDLQRGDSETYLWLGTGHEVGGFRWWCEVSKKDWRRYYKLCCAIFKERG